MRHMHLLVFTLSELSSIYYGSLALLLNRLSSLGLLPRKLHHQKTETQSRLPQRATSLKCRTEMSQEWLLRIAAPVGYYPSWGSTSIHTAGGQSGSVFPRAVPLFNYAALNNTVCKTQGSIAENGHVLKSGLS